MTQSGGSQLFVTLEREAMLMCNPLSQVSSY